MPVAVVKPQNSCVVVTASIIVSPSEEIAPAKSIASGIIDVHSSNTEELIKVHKESNPDSSKVKTVGQKVEPRLTGGAGGERQQQRKMVRRKNGFSSQNGDHFKSILLNKSHPLLPPEG